MRDRRTLWLGLPALIALTALTVLARRDPIETDLTERSQNALQAAGISGASLEFSGRDGTLSVGADALDDALELVAGLEGVRVVDGAPVTAAPATTPPTTTTTPPASTTTLVAPPPPPPTDAFVEVTSNDGGIAISGLVHSDEASTRLLETLQATFPGAAIVDQIDSGSEMEMAAPDWFPDLLDVLPSLAGLEAPFLTVESDSVTVGGAADDETVRQRVLDGLAALGLPITDEITVDAANASADLRAAIHTAGPVFFESGSAALSSEALEILASIAPALIDSAASVAVVAGHTDDVGETEANLELSLTRAAAVVDQLSALGVPTERLELRALGETEPIASNDSEAGRAANRRVEFIVEGS